VWWFMVGGRGVGLGGVGVGVGGVCDGGDDTTTKNLYGF